MRGTATAATVLYSMIHDKRYATRIPDNNNGEQNTKMFRQLSNFYDIFFNTWDISILKMVDLKTQLFIFYAIIC